MKAPALEQSLEGLALGELALSTFQRRHPAYVRRMAGYFHRASAWAGGPNELADLEQIAVAELWQAARDYRWRCPRCPRQARSRADFGAHCEAAHGLVLEPKPDLYRYVHARIGQALSHECRRYMRRARFHGPPPTVEREDGRGAEQMEAAAELAKLIARARVELEPRVAALLVELAVGGRVGPKAEREVRAWAGARA